MNDIEKIQEYVPTVYVNDSEPDLNETNLNKTEEALKRVTDAANKAIDALKQLEQEKLSLSAISSVLSDANDKVPSLALVNAMQKEIDETNSNLSNLNFEVFTGDWNDIPNGLWICSGDNAHSPAGSDGYQWIVNCEKNLSVNNYMQQAYRITGASSATKTLYRYGNSTGWRDWYAPYISNADLVSKQTTSTTDSNGLVSVGAKYPEYKNVVCTTTRAATIMHVYHNDSEWRAKAVDTSNNAIANTNITINCIAFK